MDAPLRLSSHDQVSLIYGTSTAHGNATLTCRYFGISRQTFYRWKGRYISRDLRSLEERSHRPRRLRKPTWSRELALAVLHLREQYPRWGKDKLVVMIRDRGWQVSTSMVGRILSSLKARGVLREPLRSTRSHATDPATVASSQNPACRGALF